MTDETASLGEGVPQKPLMAQRTAEEVTAAQRAAYDRARNAAHAPRSASTPKSLLIAYSVMALAVIGLIVAGALISGLPGALLGLVGGLIIVAAGGVPIWLASHTYSRERKTGRRL